METGGPMYNRYLTEAQGAEPEPPMQDTAQASGLLEGLTQRMGNFKLDADTLILLAVIWFILREGEDETDTELLIALGVLLILGM